ncbi:MAG: putative manganese transporter, partial [Jiangellaceae bacterium]
MTELLLVPLADAFMQVGVFVAILVVPFGWARRRWRRQLDDAVIRYRRWGPVVGALLGVTPGCGGAVVLMPLYARGTVSFGTVTGALVATMGDSSFVILAAKPELALQLHGLLFAAGVLTGLVVDAAGIAPRRRTVPLDSAPPAGAVAEPATAPPADGTRARDVGRWTLSAGPPVTGLLGSQLAAVVRSLSPV